MKDGTPAYERLSCEIFISTFCNLACTYCIARNLEKMVMDVESGETAIDMFISMSTGAKELEFIFTGGEPLLEFSTLRHLTKYADRNSRQFGMIPIFILKTNGSILNDEITEFLKNYNFRVVISLDGLPENHNEFRKTFSGSPTHGIITGNVGVLLDKRVNCAASLTVHPNQAKNIVDNVKFLFDLGFRDIDIGPVYGTYNWNKRQLLEFENSLRNCAELIRNINKKEYFEVSPINEKSEHVGEVLNNIWGCKAGATNLAFLPNGQISGCSSLAMLIPEYPNLVIGNIYSGINENSLHDFFSNTQANVENRTLCVNCNTKSNCSGGCVAINLSVNSDALTPPQFYCKTISLISDLWDIAWKSTIMGLTNGQSVDLKSPTNVST
jgi:uncharacterized protein